MKISYHMHPKGIRFKKQTPSNLDAVIVLCSLTGDAMGNGWSSWMDAREGSRDFGLWVLMNKNTKETYVEQKRLTPPAVV